MSDGDDMRNQPGPDPKAQSRVWVEAWSPEYGASYEVTNAIASSDEEVAPFVETEDWAPIPVGASERPRLAFIDGVSRVDARAFLDTGPLTVPGLCGSVGIGAVFVEGSRARFGPYEIHRRLIFGSGAEGPAPYIDASLIYEALSVPGAKPEDLRHGLETARGAVEAQLALKLAREGWLVVADGALGILEPLGVIGFIKSHQRAYLTPDLEPVVRALAAGERTPIFQFGVIRPRYSWYTRLAESQNQHPWAAIARCEVSATLPLNRAVELADIATFHLPRFASKAFWDTRAPQNLVPIATLERRLWHLLGDRELVYRKIRSALLRPHANQTARQPSNA
ncbi:MAG: hypothetical protein ABR507_11935 [Actinomycetota bacterium]|nr:hypothetical protein [Actinomycetota bacterium]